MKRMWSRFTKTGPLPRSTFIQPPGPAGVEASSSAMSSGSISNVSLSPPVNTTVEGMKATLQPSTLRGVNQPSPPPGWYQDPTGPGLRWWDGARWTEHQQSAAPVPPPPVAAPVQPRYQQKWWHIPLLVFLGVASTLFYVLLQFLS